MKKGDRVQLSSEWARWSHSQSHKPGRRGVITGESRDRRCWVVRFDGNSPTSLNALHKSFLEPESASEEG